MDYQTFREFREFQERYDFEKARDREPVLERETIREQVVVQRGSRNFLSAVSFWLIVLLILALFFLMLAWWQKATLADYIRWGIVPPFPTMVTKTEPRAVDRIVEKTTVINNTYNNTTLVYVPPAAVVQPAYGSSGYCPPDCDCR